jgi:hypothetical protein
MSSTNQIRQTVLLHPKNRENAVAIWFVVLHLLHIFIAEKSQGLPI